MPTATSSPGATSGPRGTIQAGPAERGAGRLAASHSHNHLFFSSRFCGDELPDDIISTGKTLALDGKKLGPFSVSVLFPLGEKSKDTIPAAGAR